MTLVGSIAADAMIPDVLRARPDLRVIFDRYGLRGCGGLSGPAETIAYFARVHGVDEEVLLNELNKGLARPEGVVHSTHAAERRDPLDELADTIYRRFFKAGIVVVLTAGAVWGAWLLLQIALRGSFTAISIHQINAHGHAQIFGWVGLFVMGFAYQAFPRMKHTSLWRPDLANLTFYLMLLGVFGRAIGEPLHDVAPMRMLVFAASAAEIVAIGLFIVIIARTLRSSGNPREMHEFYVAAALFFFFVQALYDAGLVYATMTASTGDALVQVVGTYQAALRDLQIHGFAMLMILGVGQRMFPVLFGLREPCHRLARVGLPVLVFAVIGEAGFLILMRRTGNHAWGAPLFVCVLALAATSIALTFHWGLLARPRERDRSTKFVRAAIYWLHTSMVLVVLAPLYMFIILPGSGVLSESGRHAAEIGFSHAYYGAVRHAITVGFVSLTILGMGAKVVPTLNGVDIQRLRALWTPFLLVNAGCALRVWLQIGTDFSGQVYPLVGVSGLLEVAGISIWGVHLWRIMSGWQPSGERAVEVPDRITGDHKVGQVIEWFPATLDVLLAKGFAPLANSIMRRTVARGVSLRMAAVRQGIELEGLLKELNDAAFRDSDDGAGLARRFAVPAPN
ncbi:MAG: DUF1858 domain-containing protein [Phycisphaerales bacterium]|nr:DUF1858 domain-containing protein [Phycisphaerales bacterium]